MAVNMHVNKILIAFWLSHYCSYYCEVYTVDTNRVAESCIIHRVACIVE